VLVALLRQERAVVMREHSSLLEPSLFMVSSTWALDICSRASRDSFAGTAWKTEYNDNHCI